MLEIESLLVKAEASLPAFLHKQVIEVLEIHDRDAMRPKNLIKLIVDSIDLYTMFKQQKTRDILIRAMNDNEAKEFAMHLGIKKWEDIHYKLLHTRFTKLRIKKTLEFFDKPFHDRPSSTNLYVKEIEPERALFPHQISTIKKTMVTLSTPPHKALLHMPTGSGKTISAMRIVLIHLLENPTALVIWLAHNEYLCEQSINEFQNMWKLAGDRKINIYRFFKHSNLDLSSIKDGGFLSAGLLKMLGSANKNIKFLSDLAQKTSMVVVDEAHQATAKKFSIIIQELARNKNTKLLGLSATPGRTSEFHDQENIQLARFFANQKVMLDTGKENPVKYLIKHKYLANPKFKRLHVQNNLSEQDLKRISGDSDIPQSILEKISINTRRNLIIIHEIIRLYREHKKIIVFASSVEHARIISLILTAKKCKSDYLINETPMEERNKILNSYKNTDERMVLCNYGILTTGFDAPKTSAIVIARPTKSRVLYAQMVGRGIRGSKAGGNTTCEISTIVDDDIDEFVEVTEVFTQWEDAWND